MPASRPEEIRRRNTPQNACYGEPVMFRHGYIQDEDMRLPRVELLKCIHSAQCKARREPVNRQRRRKCFGVRTGIVNDKDARAAPTVGSVGDRSEYLGRKVGNYAFRRRRRQTFNACRMPEPSVESGKGPTGKIGNTIPDKRLRCYQPDQMMAIVLLATPPLDRWCAK
jgi:hypothetical protein